MTTRPAAHEHLLTLLDAVCDERASEADFAEIERLVTTSADARWIYLTYIDLHGTLSWDACGGLSVMPSETFAASPVAPRTKAWMPGVLLVIAACVLAVTVGLTLWPGDLDVPLANHPPASTDDDQSPERSPQEIAASTKKPVKLPGSTIDGAAPVDPVRPSVPIIAKHDGGPTPPVAGLSRGSLERVVADVDQLFTESWQRLEARPTTVADNSEWVRRVYLDLVGRIPTVPEVEAFHADSSADKRRKLVDTLLDGGDYARNFAGVWSNLLIGRHPQQRVNRPAFDKFLRMSFAANRPWNTMVADIVSADGRTDQNGAANFLVAHLNNQAVPATAITARVFLGIQVQCAQCHNNPFNDMKQAAFWELNSLFQQTDSVERWIRDPRTGRNDYAFTELVNKSEGGPIYYETQQGLMKVAYPRFDGQDIDASPQTNRRSELARIMTEGEQPQLAAAFINRLWAHFLGAGFTNPIDDMPIDGAGSHNPPSHPEVLAQLSKEFIASGYDVKHLIRVICASAPYQLSSLPTVDSTHDDPANGEVPTFARAYLKPMTAEQLYDSLVTATRAHESRVSDWEAAEEQRQKWMDQFVVSLENDENDEQDTLSGTYAQALMLMNGELIERALDLSPGTFLGELIRDKRSETEKIRRLCVAALSRQPTAKELAAMQKMVREAGMVKNRTGTPRGPGAGYQDLFWALLNANEFALVH